MLARRFILATIPRGAGAWRATSSVATLIPNSVGQQQGNTKTIGGTTKSGGHNIGYRPFTFDSVTEEDIAIPKENKSASRLRLKQSREPIPFSNGLEVTPVNSVSKVRLGIVLCSMMLQFVRFLCCGGRFFVFVASVWS
jgi:hypothetical protein